MSYYKVIVVKIDVFESSIVDERHFGTNEEATEYAFTMHQAGYIPLVAKM